MRRRRRTLTADEQDLWSLVVRSVRPLRLPARKAAKNPAAKNPATKNAATKNTVAKAAGEAAAGHTSAAAVGRNTPSKNPPAKVSANSHPAKTPTGKVKSDTAGAPAPRSHGPPALQPIMRREIKKLARGGETIDARIDLHGMNQSQAHAALQSLLSRCQANGDKFVLVITGKGRSSEERGVLRRQVPVWLGLPEFRQLVAGYEIAHAGHGGEGALYVRVRKPRAR